MKKFAFFCFFVFFAILFTNNHLNAGFVIAISHELHGLPHQSSFMIGTNTSKKQSSLANLENAVLDKMIKEQQNQKACWYIEKRQPSLLTGNFNIEHGFYTVLAGEAHPEAHNPLTRVNVIGVGVHPSDAAEAFQQALRDLQFQASMYGRLKIESSKVLKEGQF